MIDHSLQNPVIPETVNPGGELSGHLILDLDEVHFWQATLDDRLAETLSASLSDDEHSRAEQFHFKNDQHDFIVARGMLRKLLAAYVGVNPSELQFCYEEKGKPFLSEPHRDSIHFNLAHSHGIAVYAFSKNRALGVDVEMVRDDLETDGIAARFFSTREFRSLQAVAPELRNRAFFDCWTRKEAYIKARGDGLLPLDGFDVSVGPGEAAALLSNDGDPGEVSRWSMRSFPVLPGYVAALVVEGHDWRLKRFAL